ncbi:Peptidase family M48 [Hymenobacter daecheongensis DSM 21074]|uniref:Peptidase family M48 n=1 Tax=Hymenobacter daecheongensis DSM 21074 TaxID=1121955 RepID=A0A1M6K2P7_9BACT|nr:M48 family metalloprotease [Hymenobacter daecheongensis]SHJ53188.1 Peptidase family M48 [Hymenobacter daecheongensis DSM 21074]
MRQLLSKSLLFLSLTTASIGISSCSKDGGGDGVVLFSIEDDKALGDKVAAQTDSTYRAKGQLLDPKDSRNNQAYAHLKIIVDKVLNNSSGQLQYRNEFPWDVKIIKDDKTLNAFASPGGHIYVFSGLIKFLDHEDQLAGVLAHEIAHADRRHTSRQLQQQYGIGLLLSVVLGENPGQLAQIAAGLGQLKFSRDFEREADMYSVTYLSGTEYACDGTAGFFIKSQQLGEASQPEFLSTHPNPDNRIQAIQAKAAELKCQGKTQNDTNLKALKSLL